MQNDPLVVSARRTIMTRIPKHIRYHTIDHTDHVINEVIKLCEHDRVPDDQMALLVIAAAWHDAGYIEIVEGHEALGAKWAIQAMKLHGYDLIAQKYVADLIRATRIYLDEEGFLTQPPSPVRFSGYLQDADMSSFAAPWEEYIRNEEMIRQDLGIQDPALFYSRSKQFIARHTWKTPAARKMYSAQTRANIARLSEHIQT